MTNKYTSEPIPFDINSLESIPKRIDLEFKRIKHGGASYEARVFINNARASEKTSKTHKGYAGSFFVFGHGGCFGDVGHCEINKSANIYDQRSEHALTPAFKRINATKAIMKNATSNKKSTACKLSNKVLFLVRIVDDPTTIPTSGKNLSTVFSIQYLSTNTSASVSIIISAVDEDTPIVRACFLG